MNRKRIEGFVKGYFYFSQSERKGIIALIILLLAIIAVPSVYGVIFPQQPLDIRITNLPVASSDEGTESVLSAHAGNNTYERFSFDPNTASDEDLKQLGFSDKNITTLHKYLGKGGKIKQPSDLEKLYGLNKKLVAELMPYVTIKGKNAVKGMLDSGYTKRKYSNVPIELNSADTTELIALYKIGPSMARRIVEHREKLGGFLTLEQLTEIWGFDEDILYDLRGKIYVDASKAKIHNVNTVALDELKTHPYFKYKLSNAIINYRTQHGPYHSLTDLKKIILVNDSIYNNITKYLKVD
jgi:competence protein ComEA